MMLRRIFVVAIALAALAAMAAPTEARHWRRGWPGYYGGPGWYGWPGWDIPPGGYYGPSYVWYVPPLQPEPAVVLPRKKCAAGRVPARWVKVRQDGREIWRHVMSRCR